MRRRAAALLAGIAALFIPGSAVAAASPGVAAATFRPLALDGDALLNGLAAAATLPLGLLVFLVVRAALRRSRLPDLPVRRKVRVPAGRLSVATTPSEPIPTQPQPVPEPTPGAPLADRLRVGLSRIVPAVRLPSTLFRSASRGEVSDDARLAWLREGESLREAGLFAEAEWKFQYGLEESARNGSIEEIGVYERALERLASRPVAPRLTPVIVRPGVREQEIANVLARVASQRAEVSPLEAPPARLRDHPPAYGRIATWEGDAITGEVRGSANLAALWGLSQHSASTLDGYLRCVALDHRAWVESAVHQALEVGDPIDVQFPVETNGGDAPRWLEASIQPVVGVDGRVERWMGATVDITAQKRAEAELGRHQDEAAAVLDTLPASAVILNAAGNVVFRNAHWRDLVGDASFEDASDAFVHPDDRARVATNRERGLEHGEAFDGEYRIWDAARGEHRWHQVRTTPLRDSAGTIDRWLTVAVDIDDQRQAQVGLNAAARARDDFIDFVSLELRGPLANLVEMSTTLERRARAPRTPVEELRKSTEELHAATEHLRDIVDAMVALARVGRGPEVEPADGPDGP